MAFWFTQAVFAWEDPVACCWVISAVYEAVCVRPDILFEVSTTIALLSAFAPVWVIEHDCVRPVVFMHAA